MKLDIKKRLLMLMLLGSLLSFLFLGSSLLYGLYGVWDSFNDKKEEITVAVADYTRDFAKDQAQESMERAVELKSETVSFQVNAIKEDVKYLSDEVSVILHSPQSYELMKLPNAADEKLPGGIPYVHYSSQLKSQGISPELEKEIGLVSNIGEQMRSLGRYYVNVFVASQNGYTVYYDTSEEKGYVAILSRDEWRDTYDARKRDWYSLGMSVNEPVFTDVYTSITGIKIVSCVMPYYDQNGVAGVLGVDCSPKNLFVQGEDGTINNGFIINDKGVILLSTMPKTFAPTSKVSKRMRQRFTGYEKMYVDGEEYFLSYAPINDTKWSIGTLLSKEEVMKDAVSAQRSMVEQMNSFYTSFVRIILLMGGLTIIISLVVFSFILFCSAKMAVRFSRPVYALMEGADEIAKGNFQHKIQVQTGDELEQLAESFNTMTDALSHYTSEIAHRAKEKSRIEAELSAATHIQTSLLPTPLPPQKEFSLAAAMYPATKVGGDFYDYYLIDESYLAVTIGDVSDKGVAAALFMAGAKTVIKNGILRAVKKGLPLADALFYANNQIIAANKEYYFVSAFTGILNIKTGEFTYVNCGHNPPVLLDGNKMSYLPSFKTNAVLGVMEDLNYTQNTIQLKSNSVIFLYTDGITFARNGSLEMFTKKRMEEKLSEMGNRKAPEELIKGMKDSVISFIKGSGENVEQSDDITMLVLNYTGCDDMEAEEIIVPAKVEELSKIISFISNMSVTSGCSQRSINQLMLVVEEIFVNIAEYAYKDKDALAVIKARMYGNPPEIELKFIDEGIPYNPLERDDPDIEASLDDRKIGGLGIYLVKKKVDDITYQRQGNKNILTIRKKMI
ncbi:SpoIIE family protein phosphatase [Anaerovibrio sp. RM50]|uniref:SpoIIE family protein phosphatase n=1 Tax=Anaerovibrio sp. RM50 TaxID=1200557 RepID=UPI000488EB5F|nr:SpoIIE family protein phosphatase [Anaerovibrio sp. RM50]